MNKLAVTAFAALALTAAAHQRASANPCSSEWSKLTTAFKKLSPILQAPICKALSTTPEQAQQCVDDYQRYLAEAEKVVAEYNLDAGSGKIGPRGLGWGDQTDASTWAERIYDGSLNAERTFVSIGLPSQNATLRLRGTGGNADASYTVTVCVLDLTGAEAQPSQSKTFASNDGTWTLQLGNTFDKRVMVYLKNSKVTLNSHKYEVSLTPSGLPTVVAAAKAGRTPKAVRRP
ncbi:MAG: hypothetical protein IPL61_17380 [Myxococcales bacterium]|nr:hypothetical protein [Myxococcales bacterium]